MSNDQSRDDIGLRIFCTLYLSQPFGLITNPLRNVSFKPTVELNFCHKIRAEGKRFLLSATTQSVGRRAAPLDLNQQSESV